MICATCVDGFWINTKEIPIQFEWTKVKKDPEHCIDKRIFAEETCAYMDGELYLKDVSNPDDYMNYEVKCLQCIEGYEIEDKSNPECTEIMDYSEVND
jgi:hypothetical protein